MFEAQVAKGAAWMDKNAPGWWQNITLSQLNLGDYSTCSLGQTLGMQVSRMLCNDTAFSVEHGFALFSEKKEVKTWFGFGKKRVFDIEKNKRNYSLLTSAWMQEILRRRHADRAQKEAIASVSK